MDKKHTVLYPIDALTIGGAEQQLLELVRRLDKTRFTPIVLTLEPGGPLENDFKAVPDVDVLSINRKGKYDFLCVFRIMRILSRRKVDIIQPYLTPANLFGLLAAFFCRTPVKIMTRRPGIEPSDGGMGYRLYYKAEAFLGRFVDWVIPNSQAGREYMISKGVRAERIKVIPNAIITSRFAHEDFTMQEARDRLGLPIECKVVGTIARLVPFKNHALLFQAAPRVLKEFPDTKFILVGNGPLRGFLEQRAKELGISSAVIFYGEQKDIGIYLSALDVAVLPSREEGFSNFILEAMTMAKPVVAMDIIGNRDIISDDNTGILVPLNDDEALAQAIIQLLQNPTAAQSMAQRAREEALSRYSVENMVQQYETLYEQTLEDKASS